MKNTAITIHTTALSTVSSTMPETITVANHGTLWICIDCGETQAFSSPAAVAAAFDLDAEELVHRAAILDGWRPQHVCVWQSVEPVTDHVVLVQHDDQGRTWSAARWRSDGTFYDSRRPYERYRATTRETALRFGPTHASNFGRAVFRAEEISAP